MNYRIELSINAQDDLVAIAEYIAHDSPTTARSFVAALRDRLEQKLAAFPASGVAAGKLHYSVFGNYVVVYRIDEERKSITVLMITEGHRDWRRLLDV